MKNLYNMTGYIRYHVFGGGSVGKTNVELCKTLKDIAIILTPNGLVQNLMALFESNPEYKKKHQELSAIMRQERIKYFEAFNIREREDELLDKSKTMLLLQDSISTLQFEIWQYKTSYQKKG